jgi:hypothetical protein
VATARAELTYDLPLRALSQQEALLNEVRARTADPARHDGDRHLTSFLLSVYVLAPKGQFSFSPHGWDAYEHFVAEGSDVWEAQRVLAYWNRAIWEGNQAVIDRMLASFRWACLALVASVLLWSIGLALE